jgi:hypothetical protein
MSWIDGEIARLYSHKARPGLETRFVIGLARGCAHARQFNRIRKPSRILTFTAGSDDPRYGHRPWSSQSPRIFTAFDLSCPPHLRGLYLHELA